MKKIISIGLIAMAGVTMSSIALSGGRIPQNFPAHSTAMDKMPMQAKDRQPSFPPSRAMGGQGGAHTPSFPSMPNQSLQGTSRIPNGSGLNGFNNRGRR
jgi:hypothetical protein